MLVLCPVLLLSRIAHSSSSFTTFQHSIECWNVVSRSSIYNTTPLPTTFSLPHLQLAQTQHNELRWNPEIFPGTCGNGDSHHSLIKHVV